MKLTKWQGCYESGWKGEIADESFAHPAKFARSLIRRIVAHLSEHYGLERGQVVIDPFGGVGLGGVVCASD
jgi:DNA modification methylase